MSEHLEVRRHTAETEHMCDRCGQEIAPGQVYLRCAAWDYDEAAVKVTKLHISGHECRPARPALPASWR